MVILSAAALITALRKARLLDETQLDELTLLPDNESPDDLVRTLLNRGWLTPFQARLALEGRIREVRLGSYILLELLGEGAMGQVFKARHPHLNRMVALKLIRPSNLAGTDAVRRFRREAQALARLSHPHLIAVHDAGCAGKRNFLAMEYVEGTNLSKLVEQRGPLPVEEACAYVLQVALGLQHIHERAMVHRDIKPSNLIVIAGDGQGNSDTSLRHGLVKILDLGLARLLAADGFEDASLTLTQNGMFLGSPDYVAPEQAEDSRKADIRSDLYALGGTLYYLLTGQVTYPGGTLIQKLDRRRREAPQPIEHLRPEVPHQVAQVVRKLLARAPEDRYQRPIDLVEDLHGITRLGQTLHVGQWRRLRGHTREVWCAAFSPDGRQALSAGFDSTVRLWDIAREEEVCCMKGHTALVLSVAFAPGGVQALSGGQDGTVRLWSIPSGDQMGCFKVHTSEVGVYAFSADGRYALIGSGYTKQPDGNWVATDCSLRVWDARNWVELRRLEGHCDLVWSVTFGPDGRRAASASPDRTVRIWDVEMGYELLCLRGHEDPVTSVAFAPDGWHVLSGSLDRTVRLWDTKAGQEVRRFEGHESNVRGVALSSCGKYALSCGNDRTVRLWNVSTGREVERFLGHTDNVISVAFSPDGRYALSGSSDRTVRLWKLRG